MIISQNSGGERMSDKLIRATAGDNSISVVFCSMKDVCNEAIKIHNLKGASAEALCKALIGAILLSSTLKNESDYVTMMIRGNGPAQGITVTADQLGNTKGYLLNSEADAKTVSALLGTGILTVSKDIGLKEPYVGKLPLVSGEIADDITSYFAESEQIASSCAIELEFNKEKNEVILAGGFLIQLLPDAPYYIISQLEADLARHPSVIELMKKYNTDYERILSALLPALNVSILSTTPVRWYCNCSKSKIDKVLIALGKTELNSILKDGKDTEVVCDFCNKNYKYSPEDIKEILNKLETNENYTVSK